MIDAITHGLDQFLDAAKDTAAQPVQSGRGTIAAPFSAASGRGHEVHVKAGTPHGRGYGQRQTFMVVQKFWTPVNVNRRGHRH
jgi:hypothetical protein